MTISSMSRAFSDRQFVQAKVALRCAVQPLLASSMATGHTTGGLRQPGGQALPDICCSDGPDNEGLLADGGAMHPGCVTKLDGPLPWELPPPLKHSDKFVSICATWQAQNPHTVYKPELLTQKDRAAMGGAVGETGTATAPADMGGGGTPEGSMVVMGNGNYCGDDGAAPRAPSGGSVFVHSTGQPNYTGWVATPGMAQQQQEQLAPVPAASAPIIMTTAAKPQHALQGARQGYGQDYQVDDSPPSVGTSFHAGTQPHDLQPQQLDYGNQNPQQQSENHHILLGSHRSAAADEPPVERHRVLGPSQGSAGAAASAVPIELAGQPDDDGVSMRVVASETPELLLDGMSVISSSTYGGAAALAASAYVPPLPDDAAGTV
jgi:hypothetical protein